MLAYKTKLEIDSGLLNIRLPDIFNGKQVEIIVLADDAFTSSPEHQISTLGNSKEEIENVIQDRPNEFQKFLLTAPTWSDKEYEYFKENHKLFNQWEIK